MDDVHDNIDNNNSNKKCKTLIVFRDMFINKNSNGIVTEVFII